MTQEWKDKAKEIREQMLPEDLQLAEEIAKLNNIDTDLIIVLPELLHQVGEKAQEMASRPEGVKANEVVNLWLSHEFLTREAFALLLVNLMSQNNQLNDRYYNLQNSVLNGAIPNLPEDLLTQAKMAMEEVEKVEQKETIKK